MKIDNEIKENIKDNSGGTAVICIIYEKKNKKKFMILNLGDSRAIGSNIYGIAQQLGLDHKPNAYYERGRIEKNGDKIYLDTLSEWRICDLSLSRSFGDYEYKPGIGNIIDVFKYNINYYKYIILACDGLWDVCENQEIIDYINECLYIKKINIYEINLAELLANLAIKKNGNDNISIIIIFFIDNINI